jgi:hypothetical protein
MIRQGVDIRASPRESGVILRFGGNEACDQRPPLQIENQAPTCISAAPAALDRYPRGVTGHVAQPVRSIRSRMLAKRLAQISASGTIRFHRNQKDKLR